MVDTMDLKSMPFWEYRFKSGRGYQLNFYNFMFSFLTFGTNNLKKSKFFYYELLKSFNIINVVEEDRYIRYANGIGTMIAFKIISKDKVDIFYNLALKLGAINEGKPGPRHDEHYYAYFRDLDGNKICAYCSD